jgi:hypothetical protein
MLLYEFKTLKRQIQIDILLEKGVHLCDRTERGYLIFLYQIDYFYVELWYSKKKKYIAELFAFSSTEHLEPYLPSINISGLLQGA